MRSRLRLAALLACAAALPLPAGAAAASTMATGIADDRAVLEEPDDARARATVADWAALGIDQVRIFAQWDRIETAPGTYEFTALDRAVKLVSEGGLRPLLTITGPGPLWTSSAPGRGNPRYAPSPERFGAFAGAVAIRYSAAIDTYIVWNEPNLPLWLQPQNTCKGRRCTPLAPHLYRRLVRAAYPAIKAADPSSTVLAGALAPRGDRPTSINARTKPLAFLRAMGCVDARFHRDRQGPCQGFQPATADAIAYHPHATTFSPLTHRADPDEASIADLPRLERTLDAVQRARGLRRAGAAGPFPLFLTEWGYQTRPPDPIQGVTLAQQSRWLQQGARIAARDPRVRLLVQYEWRDEPLGRGSVFVKYSGWQSGLRFADGRPKPALATFANPFDLTASGRRVTLWGQVRPGGAHVVALQRRTPPSRGWTTVRTLTTAANGSFTWATVPTGKPQFRFTWTDVAGATRTSDVLSAQAL